MNEKYVNFKERIRVMHPRGEWKNHDKIQIFNKNGMCVKEIEVLVIDDVERPEFK